MTQAQPKKAKKKTSHERKKNYLFNNRQVQISFYFFVHLIVVLK